MDKFQTKLSELLSIPKDNVDVFSVQLRRKHPPLTDVRFSAHGSPWYKPVKLNGLVLVSMATLAVLPSPPTSDNLSAATRGLVHGISVKLANNSLVKNVLTLDRILILSPPLFLWTHSLLQVHREEIERDVGINITMVSVDECLYENQACEGSCTNTLDISPLPYMVNANKTALVGVRVDVLAECTCGARNFSKAETCRSSPCYNGGRCVDGR